MGPTLPLHIQKWSYRGGVESRVRFRSHRLNQGSHSLVEHLQLQVGLGDAGPAGSLVSMLLSPIIHAGNWPACPAPAPVVIYGRRRSKKKAE